MGDQQERPWTDTDDAALRALWEMLTHYHLRDRYGALARMLHRDPARVRARCTTLLLIETNDRISTAQARLLSAMRAADYEMTPE